MRAVGGGLRGAARAALVGVVACGGADGGSAAVDPAGDSAAPAACTDAGDCDSADLCADAPVVTWETFGQGLLIEDCQPCHASTAADRHGAPAEVTFDTHADALRWRADILRVATGDAPTMPPALDLGATAREQIVIWLTCFED